MISLTRPHLSLLQNFTRFLVIPRVLPLFRRHFSEIPEDVLEIPLKPIQTVEIEAKFPFRPEDEQRIAQIAKLINQKTFIDVYYDHPTDYTLTSRDLWLRKREGSWQLKIPVSMYKDKGVTKELSKDLRPGNVDDYQELDSDSKIVEFLLSRGFITRGNSLQEALALEGYIPFGELKTERKSFHLVSHSSVHPDPALKIDLDTAFWGKGSTQYQYHIGEIELMVDNCPEQIVNAQKKLRYFAELNGFNIRSGLNGKVLEYLRLNSPKHFQALKDYGLLESKKVCTL